MSAQVLGQGYSCGHGTRMPVARIVRADLPHPPNLPTDIRNFGICGRQSHTVLATLRLKECWMVKLFPVGTRTRFVDLVCSGVSLQDTEKALGASEGLGSRWWR